MPIRFPMKPASFSMGPTQWSHSNNPFSPLKLTVMRQNSLSGVWFEMWLEKIKINFNRTLNHCDFYNLLITPVFKLKCIAVIVFFFPPALMALPSTHTSQSKVIVLYS